MDQLLCTQTWIWRDAFRALIGVTLRVVWNTRLFTQSFDVDASVLFQQWAEIPKIL